MTIKILPVVFGGGAEGGGGCEVPRVVCGVHALLDKQLVVLTARVEQ